MLAFYLSMLESDQDKSNFEQLYIKYKQDMYAVAYDVLKNVEDAEDAVHTSFIKIAENFKRISLIPCDQLKPFIVIISKNTAINMYNSNKRKAKRSVTLNENIVVVDDFFEKEDYYVLMEAIKDLPQKYKDVIYLFYVYEFSAKEIAKILDISVDNVYQKVFRAKKMVKETLEGCEAFE